MPVNQRRIKVPFNRWRRLSENEVTRITFLVEAGKVRFFVGGDEEPTSTEVGVLYLPNTGERMIRLEDMVEASGTHLWAYGLRRDGSVVYVDHA